MKTKNILFTFGLLTLLAFPACANPPFVPTINHAVTVGSDGFVHQVIIIVTTNSADVGLILTNGTYIGQMGRKFYANYRQFGVTGTNNADYFGNGDNYIIGDVDSGGYGHIAIGCGPAGVIYLGNSVGDAIFPHDVQAGSFTDGTGTLPQANTIMTNGQPLGTIRPSIVGSDVVANSFTTEGSAGGALDSVVGEASGNDSFQGHIMLSSFYGTYSGMTPLPSGFTGTVTNLYSINEIFSVVASNMPAPAHGDMNGNYTVNGNYFAGGYSGFLQGQNYNFAGYVYTNFWTSASGATIVMALGSGVIDGLPNKTNWLWYANQGAVGNSMPADFQLQITNQVGSLPPFSAKWYNYSGTGTNLTGFGTNSFYRSNVTVYQNGIVTGNTLQ